MHSLLQALESGRSARFDNTKPAVILPAGHAFSITCPCPRCEHTWAKR